MSYSAKVRVPFLRLDLKELCREAIDLGIPLLHVFGIHVNVEVIGGARQIPFVQGKAFQQLVIWDSPVPVLRECVPCAVASKGIPWKLFRPLGARRFGRQPVFCVVAARTAVAEDEETPLRCG